MDFFSKSLLSFKGSVPNRGWNFVCNTPGNWNAFLWCAHILHHGTWSLLVWFQKRHTGWILPSRNMLKPQNVHDHNILRNFTKHVYYLLNKTCILFIFHNISNAAMNGTCDLEYIAYFNRKNHKSFPGYWWAKDSLGIFPLARAPVYATIAWHLLQSDPFITHFI